MDKRIKAKVRIHLYMQTMIDGVNLTNSHASEALFTHIGGWDTYGFTHVRKNNAHARTEMARKYNNNHHHVQSFVVGQYVSANIYRLDRAATDNNQIPCSIVDVAGSKEQPGYKLRCLYGLLKGLHPSSALAAVSTAIPQSQENSISSKTGKEITLAHAARRHLPTISWCIL